MSDLTHAVVLIAGLLGGLLAGARLHRRVAGRRLNEAIHELRRPLQALALAPGEECRRAWMAQAAAALAELDALVNGGSAGERSERVALAAILADARRRWAPLTAVRFRDEARLEELRGDPRRVGAALDNLIANAVEHGCGPIDVRAVGSPGTARLEVVNSRPADPAPAVAAPDPRRGHGLRVGGRIAAEHGGGLLPPAPVAGSSEIVAALELPGAGG